MKRLLPLAAALAFAAACGVPSGSGPPPITPTVTAPAPSPSPATSQPPALHQVHDPGHVTGTLTGPCHMTGTSPNQLPDPGCTPGAYDPAITAAILCSGHYTTRTYRPPASETTAFKYQQAYPAYGLPQSATTELDHLVSLELGGSNDATNLWPEPPGVPNPKDTVENRLHAWVCAGTGADAETRLHQAQATIAANWTTAEQTLEISP